MPSHAMPNVSRSQEFPNKANLISYLDIWKLCALSESEAIQLVVRP